MTNSTIVRFIERIRQAQRSQGKQIIMPISEAQDVANALSELLIKQADLQTRVIQLLEADKLVTFEMQGGTFK